MVVYQRFQLQGFDLESFGVLDSYRLSLMGGGCTWRFDGNNSTNNIIIIIIIMIMIIVICELCHPGGGGGYSHIWAIHRYVPRNRVWFLRVSVLK